MASAAERPVSATHPPREDGARDVLRSVRSAGKVWLVVALALVTSLAMVGVVLAWSHPYRHPERYLADVETAARPLIDAIDAYTRRVGAPPERLEQLLPVFDASRVETGYPPQRHFLYRVWRKGVPEDAWGLFLFTDLIALDSDTIQYDSRSRVWETRPLH